MYVYVVFSSLTLVRKALNGMRSMVQAGKGEEKKRKAAKNTKNCAPQNLEFPSKSGKQQKTAKDYKKTASTFDFSWALQATLANIHFGPNLGGANQGPLTKSSPGPKKAGSFQSSSVTPENVPENALSRKFLNPSKRASGLLYRRFLYRKSGVENVPYEGGVLHPFWEGCHS